MKTKQLSSKQLIALVLILIGAVSSIFGITGLTKSSSEDPYESRNGIVMVYATVYDNEGNSEAGMGTGWAIGTPGQPIQYIVTNGHVVNKAYTYPRYDSSLYGGEIDVFFSAAENDYVKAKVVYFSPQEEKDIAILQLPSPTDKRTALTLRDSGDIKIGDNVLLQGCGAIGSIILNMLLLKGGANVTVSDPIAEKRETALKLGAQYVIDPKNEDLKERAMEITNGRGYDVIFDVSGVPAAAPLLPKLLANKGTVVYFAVFPMDYELPLNLYDLYIKEGRLQTVFTTIYNYPRVIDLIPRMNLDVIANREMKLSDGVEIFNAFLESKSNKIIVDCQH